MHKPLVSVVMVVCNVDRFLAASIESILTQTFREFEFIVVDFGSTDTSKPIVSSYMAKDSRMKVHEIPHCSLAEARNAACSLAEGQYIAIMDADDVSLPNRLRWQVSFMEKEPDVGLLGGAVEWIDGTGRPLHVQFHPAEDDEIRAALPNGYPFCHPSLIMRRDTFLRAGGYRPAFTQAEDYDLAIRMSEQCKCSNLKQVVLKYRIHPYQDSMRKVGQQALAMLAAQVSAVSRKNRLPDPFDSIKVITPEALAALGVTKARQKGQIATYSMQWVRNMCMAGEYSVALREALKVLRSDLDCIEGWRVADLRLLVAGLYWKQGRFVRSCLTLVRALASRPITMGRPIKPLLRRLQHLNHQRVALRGKDNEDFSHLMHV